MNPTKQLVRAGTLAAALVLAVPFVPALAGASGARGHHGTHPHGQSIHGIVLASSTTLDTVTLNTPHGAVTVHVSAAAASHVYLGGQVVAVATKLADGTYQATSVREHGRANHTEIRGTVVSATATQLVVSSGRSQMGLQLGTRQSHASHHAFAPGQIVRAGIVITPTSLDATNVQVVGQSDLIELSGTLGTVTTASLTINVENGATTTVSIPTTLTLPSTFITGTPVEMLVSFDPTTNAFTLVTISSEVPQGGAVVNPGEGNLLEVEGLVAAVSATSLTVQPGDNAAAVTFTVPAGLDVSSLYVGERIDARGTVSVTGTAPATTTYALVSFHVSQAEGAMRTEAEGLVQSISPTSITIQRNEHQAAITFTLGPNSPSVASLSVGERVHARGMVDSTTGLLTLTAIWAQGSGDQGNPGNPGSQGDQGGQSGVLQIDGTVSANSGTTLTILPSEGGSLVALVVPAALDVAGFTTTYGPGVHVHATATMLAGVETLVTIAPQD
ncbi:MAG: hypothetical protein ACP5OV_06870 [Acidimicrobiales bacterium]